MLDEALTVEEIFSRRVLRVPDYQRGYAWELPQWRDLLDDLEMLPDGRDHYTGTLVLHPQREKSFQDDEGNSYEIADIVDGQQRLTTIVILLEAIRREMVGREALRAIAEGTRKRYLTVNDGNGLPVAKLQLNRDSREFFFRSVLSEQQSLLSPTIASHRRLLAARDYFVGHLAARRQSSPDDYESWLRLLREKATHRLRLSLYRVSEASDVGVIFEVLNNRGKPLSELDKVKNYLLYAASKLDVPAAHDLADRVNSAWTHILERLMAADLTKPDDEDQLLRAHWLMAYDHRPKAWDGTRSIKSRFDLRSHAGRHVELLQDLHNYVETLEQASLAFADCMRPSRTGAFASFALPVREEIARTSEKFRRIGAVSAFLPLFLAARLRAAESGDQYLALVMLCERIAFRVYRLSGIRSDAGQSSLYRLGAELFMGQADIDSTLVALRGFLLRYCSRAKFEESLRQKPWYENDWYRWKGLRYLLYEFEEHLAGGRVVRLPWDHLESHPDQTVEHVLPQTPEHKSGYWTSRFDLDARRLLTDDLGNLALTNDNSAYGNRPFPEKKGELGSPRACYANATVFMERALAAYSDWTPETVNARRKEIVDWALRRWSVQDEDGAEVTPAESDED